MRRLFLQENKRLDNSCCQKGFLIMKKQKIYSLLLLMTVFLLGISFVRPVEAKQSSEATKAYKQFLAKKVSEKKYFKIVNVGDNNAPVLLVGRGEKVTFKKNKVGFEACDVYAYVNGKVKKMKPFSEKYGAKLVGLYKKNGKNYLYNGLSDSAVFYRVKGGKTITYQYYNCRSGEKDDLYKKSVVKKDGKKVKSLGYLKEKDYTKYKDSYKVVKSSIAFQKNIKKNR